MPPKTQDIITDHILSYISHPPPSRSGQPPLFVGLQGPQGAGKTTLTNTLLSSLSSLPHNLRVVVFSIDDLLLPYEGLRNVAYTYRGNGLLDGRGHAGTHDVELGARLLRQLHDVNSEAGAGATEETKTQEIKIPKFDKSAHDGYGDRAPEIEWPQILGSVDVVILEGWCFGFYPLEEDELVSRWEKRWELGVPQTVRMEGGVEDIKVVNQKLNEYVERWYGAFTCFVQIAAPLTHPYEFIYKWRLQQEHSMKANNGGRGMSDEEVVTFVDRYIPGYVFFVDGVQKGYQSRTPGKAVLPPWSGRGLRITIDEHRQVINTEKI